MNNKKRIVNRVALSALMLSALASPIAANAAPLSSDGPVKAVTAASALAFKLQDPLAVAKRYAPDTVQAWESLLAKYDALNANAGQALRVDSPSIALTPDGSPLALTPVDADIDFTGKDIPAGEAVAVQSLVPSQSSIDFDGQTGNTMDGTVLKEGFATVSGGENNIGKADASGLALTPVDTDIDFTGKDIPAGKAVAVQGVTVKLSEGDSTTTAGAKLVAVQADANSLLQGQIDLAKAVESKNADDIRSSLAHLFDIYKAEVEHMQA
ncbi:MULTISPECIES: hypothetical protein [unclassified Paenibacillus]|uniref:hypothetical protein n=1 Tax=unclassified Paenibacillus TaxID=185978 RepID=UPI0030F9319E